MAKTEPTASEQKGPQSQHDWTIHSINIHGVFFERWCQRVIMSASPWRLVTTNYPVHVSDHESTLDIRADFDTANGKVILLVECKKNNPEFVDWVFFPKPLNVFWLPHITTLQYPQEADGVKTDIQARMKDFPIERLHTRVTDEARETRGNYQDYRRSGEKTRTSNAAIGEAAKQIALATESVYREELKKVHDRRDAGQAPLIPNITILPVIVTSANLFLCEFNADDISGETGEIAYSKTTLTPTRRVIHEYPLPGYLRHTPAKPIGLLRDGDIELFVRRHIAVVHSSHFKEFLDDHAPQLKYSG